MNSQMQSNSEAENISGQRYSDFLNYLMKILCFKGSINRLLHGFPLMFRSFVLVLMQKVSHGNGNDEALFRNWGILATLANRENEREMGEDQMKTRLWV